MSMLNENYPTRKRMTVIIPVVSGGLTAIGAALIAYSNGLPFPQAWSSAWGWGFVAGANSLWLVSHGIHMERTAWWNYKAKQVELDIAKHPEKYEDFEPMPEPAQEPQQQAGYYTYVENGQKILHINGRGKHQKKGVKPAFASEVTQYIGSIVLKEPNQGETYTVVDVQFGLWLFAQYDGADKDTTEKLWTGEGKPFSLREYRLVRDGLIEDNLARWRNARGHTQGWEFTARARALMYCLKGKPRPTSVREVKIDEKSAK